MIDRRWIRSCVGSTAMLWLAGCGGLLETTIPPPQTYVLRLAPPDTAAATAPAGSVRVQRPVAGPGLETDRIILLRSEKRFDSFAASRWAAPAPDMVESMVVDALRATGKFTAVFDDSAPYPPQYNLRVRLQRFEAEYAAGGGAPVVHVTLEATLGRHRDHTLLASFSATGSVPAAEDRMGAVVTAFGAAASTAVNQLAQDAAAAVANEPPSAAEARK